MTGEPQRDAEAITRRSGEFPDYRIWREDIHGRVRYVARARCLQVRPYALVSGDLTEIWSALSTQDRQGEDGHRIVMTTESVRACQE